MNNISISGRLGADPELSHVGNDGNTVCNFSVAEDHGYGTNWFKVAAWGGIGETIAEYLSKGDFIEVQGTMEQKTWTDQDGNEQTRWQLRADSFGFGGGGNDGDGDGDYSSDNFEDDAPF
jgi:single-strand DNA-binding protein